MNAITTSADAIAKHTDTQLQGRPKLGGGGKEKKKRKKNQELTTEIYNKCSLIERVLSAGLHVQV